MRINEIQSNKLSHTNLILHTVSHTWEGFEPRGFKVWTIWIQTVVAGKRSPATAQVGARFARLGITSDRSNTGKWVFFAEKSQLTTNIVPKMWDRKLEWLVRLVIWVLLQPLHYSSFLNLHFSETIRLWLWKPSPNFGCYDFIVKLGQTIQERGSYPPTGAHRCRVKKSPFYWWNIRFIPMYVLIKYYWFVD